MSWNLSAFADEANEMVDQQIEALQRGGLKFVDLRMVDGVNIAEVPEDLAQKTAAKLADAGITVAMYGSPLGKIDISDDFEIDKAKLNHIGKISSILGAKMVRIFSYFNRNGASHADWQKVSLERLRELCDIAAKYDLVLYHENEREIYGDLVADVCVLRDQLRSNYDNFKLIFDFDNFNQSGEDVWAAWEELRDATDAIHLKDSKKQPDGSFQHVPSGQGDGRIKEILADAAERGFDGPFTLEPHLARSKAVVATGPHGESNANLGDLSEMDAFHVAAETAVGLFKSLDRWD